MKTTLYGNGKDTNDQGIPKVPKETNFVHPVYSTKLPLPIATMREMCDAFYQANGRYPEMLYIAGGSIGTKYTSFRAHGPEQGAVIGLSIVYDAPETKVA